MRNAAAATALAALIPGVVQAQAGRVSPPAGMGQGSGLVPVAPGVFVARVPPLVQVSIPQGTLVIPRGWTLERTRGVEGAYVAPPGQTEPEIYFIPAFAVSDLQYELVSARCAQQFFRDPLFAPDAVTCLSPGIRRQIVDSSHPWPPAATVQSLVHVLASAGGRFGAPRITARSQTAADYEVVEAVSGQELLDWGTVAMVYLPNPLLASPYANPGITSLAFLDGCRAPLGGAAAFRSVCAAVHGSVRLNRQWLSALVRARIRVYVQEFNSLMRMGESIIAGFGLRSAMIQRFGRSVQRMQDQMFQRMQEARVHETQDWAAALRGEVVAVDPHTGKRFSLPYASLPFRAPTYCRTQLPDRVLIGDQSNPNLRPGASTGGYACEAVLHAQF